MTVENLAPLVEFLRETIGLAVESVGHGLIERAARRGMAAAECTAVAAYVERLRAEPALRQQLVEELVVAETWFFRDRKPFELVARLASRRRPPLRLLSIPCSTGEEPYSIAISLLEAGLAPEDFAVDAVDISHAALAAARRASYGANSFRGDRPDTQAAWFTPESGRLHLKPRARAQVSFHHGNVFAFAPGARYDFIFCRNLLIYFDGPGQDAAVKRLVELLADDGVLFFGHSESAIAARAGLAAVPEPGAFAFVRRPAGAEKTRAAPARPPAKPKASPPPVASAPRPFADVKPRTASAPAAPSLEAIQALADNGSLDEAARLAKEHIAAHGPTVAGYHLLALVLDAAGDAAGAEAAYRKVLYLDPRHEEAIAHLALLLESRGDPEAARMRMRIRKPAGKGGSA